MHEIAKPKTRGARPGVNAHIHLPPNFSAFETMAQAVELASAQGVRVLGASNYYDYSIYSDFSTLAKRQNVFPLFGLEIIARIDSLVQANVKINDPGNPGKMYICGKGITRFAPMSEEAATLLEVIRRNDSERMARMTARLAEVFAQAGVETGLTEDRVKDQVMARHGCPRETVYLQERHLAQAFQEALFAQVPGEERGDALAHLFGTPSKSSAEDAVGVQNEIRSHLMKAGKAAYVEETFVDFDHAYRLILALGGIPCYPILADGATPICAFEAPLERLIDDLRARHIYCAELIPIRNQPDVLRRYVEAVRAAGLIVTAGTEHNTRDLLPIEPTCVQGQPIPDDLKEIFWEGACVVAAHQHLTERGEPGFVDGEGNPNAAFATSEERIAHFRALGETVLRDYLGTEPRA